MNKQEINKVIDQIHRQGKSDLQTSLQLIKQHDYEFNKDEILEIITSRDGRKSGEYFTPNKIAELIAVIGKIYNPKAVIDICCGTGNVLSYFSNLQSAICKGYRYKRWHYSNSSIYKP